MHIWSFLIKCSPHLIFGIFIGLESFIEYSKWASRYVCDWYDGYTNDFLRGKVVLNTRDSANIVAYFGGKYPGCIQGDSFLPSFILWSILVLKVVTSCLCLGGSHLDDHGGGLSHLWSLNLSSCHPSGCLQPRDPNGLSIPPLLIVPLIWSYLWWFAFRWAQWCTSYNRFFFLEILLFVCYYLDFQIDCTTNCVLHKGNDVDFLHHYCNLFLDILMCCYQDSHLAFPFPLMLIYLLVDMAIKGVGLRAKKWWLRIGNPRKNNNEKQV